MGITDNIVPLMQSGTIQFMKRNLYIIPVTPLLQSVGINLFCFKPLDSAFL